MFKKIKVGKGKYRPALCCHVCETEIKNLNGNVIQTDADLFLLFLHKGACTQLSEENLEKQGVRSIVFGLDVFLAAWMNSAQCKDFDMAAARHRLRALQTYHEGIGAS